MDETFDLTALTMAAQAGLSQAQYRLGALYFSKGEIRAALDWLSRAADDHIADAQNMLGIIYLNGIGTPRNLQKAAGLFAAAAGSDLKEAHFNLSGMIFSGRTEQQDDADALKHLLKAAEFGHRAALRVLGYLYSSDGRADFQLLATRCFARAALLGDPHSEYVLGICYLNGVGMDVNHDEAAYWFSNAANKRLYCADLRLKSLAVEMGEARLQHIMQHHVPEAERIAIGSLELRATDRRVKMQSRSRQSPGAVAEYPGILHDTLCDYLINLAAPRLLASGVVDPATGKSLKTTLRTSSSMNFELSMYDMAVGVICRRLAGLSGIDPSHAEPISILRYLPGEEYKPHYDHFAVDDRGTPKVQDTNGQRRVTVFAYLNNVEAGGETDFPRLAVRVQPGKGKAVAFLNCDASGKPNPDTLHAGMPVLRGEKWLATLWLRERPFNWI